MVAGTPSSSQKATQRAKILSLAARVFAREAVVAMWSADPREAAKRDRAEGEAESKVATADTPVHSVRGRRHQ